LARPPIGAPQGSYQTVPQSVRRSIDVESELDVYAIVRAGGRQEKVSVGDVLIIDKVKGEAGDTIDLTPLLVVDGGTITSDAAKLAKVTVTAEVVKAAKGPKITIMKFKNKTGYRKRQGHRQHLTQVKVTQINQNA
jgi:large subunit ribosomal protein L21